TVRTLSDGPAVVESICLWDPHIIFVSSTARLTEDIALAPILRQISRAQVVVDVPRGFSDFPAQSAPIITERAAELTFDELSYDPQRRLLLRASRCCSVSPCEGVLIELFLRHPETVLRPQAVLDAVWPDRACGLANLRTHIHNLRSKIDTADERRLLHTVRGVGYVLSSGMARPPDVTSMS
ncbi:MAG: winged helix-turn-helix domain-containing protein, partial [Candidatus Eremiobacteraeota bacterium]|nr:winged helix-turn-helix domain-containing protein [Candidatus Eremiobacteraeota bacterium]